MKSRAARRAVTKFAGGVWVTAGGVSAGVDDRQARLVVAAETVCRWVHAQRAAWSHDGAAAIASEPCVAAPPPALAVLQALPAAEFPETAIAPAAPGPRPPWAVSLEPAVAAVSRWISMAGWIWRPVALALGVVLLLVAARASWSTWGGLLAKPIAVGQDVVAAGRLRLAAQAAPRRSAGRSIPAPASGISARIGRLQVDSDPPGARVSVDGHDRGVTPLLVKDLAAGSHVVLVRSDTGSIQRTVAIKEGQTAALSEAICSGWLHVSSPIELQMSEGARSIRLDDSNHALLGPGSHAVTFENRALGFKEVRQVDVRPGGTTSVTIDPPPSSLSVSATEPAEVSIDGEWAGRTPLTDLPIRIGTRDITVTASSGAVRRMTTTVTLQPARVDVDFTTP